MSLKRQFAKLRAPFRRREPADDLAEEIRVHLRMEEQENLEAGMSPEEAHYAALRRFGNVTLAHESSRQMWAWNCLEVLCQDVRYGLRQLRRNPGFTAVAVLTLALGIGANTAIFSVLQAVVLRPLPYEEPGRLVVLWTDNMRKNLHEERTSYPNFEDWKKDNHVFDDMAFCSSLTANLTGGDRPERVVAARVTSNLFSMVGVSPVLGHTFTPEDETRGNRVIVLSHGLWQRRFGSSREVLGKTLVASQQ
jgi:hypothetical protein